MRNWKWILSLMPYVLTPVLGACGAVEAPSGGEALVQADSQALVAPIEEPLCEIDQPCEPYPEPDPTPLPPLVPSSITHPDYSRASFSVTWGTAYRASTYHLEEQVNLGTWRQIYQGYGTSHYVSGRSAAEYRYRVRACNAGGCSSYKMGTTMVVRPEPVVDLYAKYPFLYTHDQQNATYQSQTTSFKTGFSGGGTATLTTTVNGNFYLGQGYNLTTGDVEGICLDTNHPDFHIITNAMNERSFTVTRATSLSHLSQLLDVDASGGISLGLKNFTLDVKGSKERLSKEVGDAYKETIVARWEKKLDHWTLNTGVESLRADYVSNMLIPFNTNAQSDFRETCGDKYIDGVTRGARLYMVFSFDAKRYSSQERETKAASVLAKIKEVLNANGAYTVTTETVQLLQQVDVQINAYALGGDGSVEVELNEENFGTKFQSYVNTVNSSNVVAVEQQMSHYDHPTAFLNYGYFDIFADYRTPLEQLRRWNGLELERAQRCKLSEAYGLDLANCVAAGIEMVTAQDQCRYTLNWAKCKHPLSYYTETGSGGAPSYAQLYDWMGQNVKALERTVVFQDFDHHVVGSWGSKTCKSFTDSTCLPSTACAVDTSQGEYDGIGQGFSYKEHYWDGPGSGSTRSHGIPLGSKCMKTTSTLCTSQFGDTTADFRFTQGIYGQCPATRAFALVY